MRRLLAVYRDARRVPAAVPAREATEEAAAAAVAWAEEAGKAVAEPQPAKGKRKKGRHQSKREEAVSRPAKAGGARGATVPPGASPPTQRPGS